MVLAITPLDMQEFERRKSGAITEQSDDDLVQSARSDPRAFAPLYQRYVSPIYRYCYVRLGHRESAEDATSEVFMKALRGLDSYRGGVFAAWLFKIAQNVVIDFQRRIRPLAPVEAAGDPVDPGPSPEEHAVARDDAATLRRAMARLAEDQRTVLDLQLAGWSGDRIAASLGRSVDAVKMLRHRGVTRLREILAEDTGSLGGQR